jgi:hypothetical protein
MHLLQVPNLVSNFCSYAFYFDNAMIIVFMIGYFRIIFLLTTKIMAHSDAQFFFFFFFKNRFPQFSVRREKKAKIILTGEIHSVYCKNQMA